MKVRWYVASFNQWLISVIVPTVSFCLSCSGRGGSDDAEGSPPCRTGPALQHGAVLGTRFGKHVAHWLWMCVGFMSRLAVDMCQLHVPFGCGCVSASCPIWLLMNIGLHLLWFLVNLTSPLLWLFVDIPHTKQCQYTTTVRIECAKTNMPNDSSSSSLLVTGSSQYHK